MTPTEKLEAAIKRANDLVISASLAIMDEGSYPLERAQARYFQSLFSEIRNVMQGALGGARDLSEGATPDEPGSTRDILALADAVLGGTE